MYFLTLDHVSHCLAGNIKEPLNVKVIGCQDQLKECSLINLRQKIGQVLNKGCQRVSKEMTPQAASHGPSENLHPRRKCRQSSSPCSHRPQGVGGHPVNHCFIKSNVVT